MVSLNYSISKEDYIRFYTYVMWDSEQNAPKRRRYYLRQVIPPLLFLLAFYYTGLLRREGSFIILIAVFLIGITILSLKNARSNIQRQAEKISEDPGNTPIFEPRILQASETGIRIRESFSETVYQWQAFTKKQESDRFYILFTDSIHALIIPKRSFTDQAHQSAFDKLLQQHLSLDAEVGHLIKS